MKITRFGLQSFRAFDENFELDLDGGKNLLLHGENGSGKSSLYWALYTFLQSARKQTSNVAKYFDPADISAPEAELDHAVALLYGTTP